MIFTALAAVLAAIIVGVARWSFGLRVKEIEDEKKEIIKYKEEIEKDKIEINKLKIEVEGIAESCRNMHGKAKDDTTEIEKMKKTVKAKMQSTEKDQKYTEEDKEQIDKASKDEDIPPEVRRQAQGLKAEAEERWEDAIKIWQELVDAEPKNDDALFRLAYCYQQAAEKDSSQASSFLFKAAQYYERVVGIDPSSVAFSNWGLALSDLGKLRGEREKFKEACGKYERATELDPNYAAVFSNWGIALRNLGTLTNDEDTFNEAFEKYQRATELDPKDAVVFSNWGTALDELGRLTGEREKFKEACEKYQRATELDPKDAVAFSNWGNALSGLGALPGEREKFKEAFAKYQRATELDPKYVKAFNNWGNALMNLAVRTDDSVQRQELLKQAQGKVLQAEELKPGEGAYNLACIAALLDEPDECRRYLNLCLEHGTMVSCVHLRNDPAFDSVRDFPWFKEIEAKVCGESSE